MPTDHCPGQVARSLTRLPWPDLALVLGLFGLAAAVRWPFLTDAPRYTDEMGEVLRSLDIARGVRFPLTNVDAYIGPLWNYLLAGAMWLAGPSPELPRQVVMVASALTVVATYLLGRQVAGRAAGLLAAALLVGAPWHVLIQSHVAWSHCLTPLLTTGCLLLVARALDRRDGRLLVLAGLLAGLALQTHPSAVSILPGVGLAFLLHPVGRGWLGRRWPDLTVYAALLGYAPILAYNALYPLATMKELRAVTYAVADPDADRYLAVLAYLPQRMLHDLLGATLGPALEQGQLGWPTTWLAWPVAGLVLAALAYGVARRRWLLLLSFGSVILLTPLISHEYAGGRYVAAAWPPLFVLIGALLAAGIERGTRALSMKLARRLGTFEGAPVRVRRAAPALVGMLALVLAAYPLPALTASYAGAAAGGRTNDQFVALAASARAASPPGLPILLDDRLLQHGATYKEGSAYAIFRYLLTLNGEATGRLVTNEASAKWLAKAPRSTIAIMTAETRDELTMRFGLGFAPVAPEEVILTPVRSGRTITLAPSPPIGVFRLERGTTSAVATPVEEQVHPVFDGVIGHGWTVSGWNGRLGLHQGGPDARPALATTLDGRFGGLAFTHWPALSATDYDRLDLMIHGGDTGDQRLQIGLRDTSGAVIAQVPLDHYVEMGGVAAGTWRHASIPLDLLGAAAGEIGGFQIQSLSRDPLPTVYLADVRFVGRAATADADLSAGTGGE